MKSMRKGCNDCIGTEAKEHQFNIEVASVKSSREKRQGNARQESDIQLVLDGSDTAHLT